MVNIKVGDKFYTIAYIENPIVIQVEVTDIFSCNGKRIVTIHRVNVNDFHTWMLPIEEILKWKFDTVEEAESKLYQ